MIASIEIAGDHEFSFPTFDEATFRLLLWNTDANGKRSTIAHIWECENGPKSNATRRLRRLADKAVPGNDFDLTPSAFRKAHEAAHANWAEWQ